MKSVIAITAIAASIACASTRVPLVFEPNRGQAPAGADFIARTPDATVLLDSTGATLLTSGAPVRMLIKGARHARMEPLDRLPGVTSYFKGNDPSKWRTGIPQYGKVRYANVYRGVDLVYYGAESRLEYDFVVSPGASADNIEIAFEGADRVRVDAGGDLAIEANGRTIRQLRPHVYQWTDKGKQEVAAGYRIRKNGSVQFALARYDAAKPLVIDPVIQYSTYIGRGGQDTGIAVAVDAAGNAYIAGETTSNELATSGAVQAVRAGDQDAFIAKVSPAGTLLFLTYIGGNRTDTGLAIAVDGSGNPYICGVTLSSDFPVPGAPQATLASTSFDAFVVKLNSAGTQLVYGTYLGGSATEWASSIAVDAQGGTWVTGWTTSADFPVRSGLYTGPSGGGEDVFVTRIAPSGQAFTYSTFFGGNGRDISTGIAVDAAGGVYVSGATTSTAFPLVNPVQSAPAGKQDAFVFKLSTQKNTLEYSTLLGGSGDDLATRIAVDPAGNAYVAGNTNSTNFPTTAGAFRTSSSGGTDLFALKLTPAGTVAYSTYIGGIGDDWAGGVAVDTAGTMYISGWTNSQNFPTPGAAQPVYQGGEMSTQRFDAVALRLSPGGDQLIYSTYLGGRGEDKAYAIALDGSNNVLLAGSTTSADLPSASGAFSPGLSTTDIFVTRLSADASVSLFAPAPAIVSLLARTTDTTLAPQSVRLTSTGGPLTFVTSSSAPWLKVLEVSGTTPTTLTLVPDVTGLTPGTYTADVTVQGTTRAIIRVTLVVTAAPGITSISPSPVPRSDTDVTLTVAGAGFVPGSYLEVNGTRINSTVADARTLRAVLPAALVNQTGTLTLAVVNPDSRSNPMQLAVASGAPVLNTAGVVHAATHVSGPIAPGQMIVISAPGIEGDAIVSGPPGFTVADTRVLFDGNAALITRVQPAAVWVVVPYSLTGRDSTSLVVEHRGRASAPLTVPVVAASPGLFTADYSGTGQAAALNENGAANGAAAPAGRGSILVLFGTGEGAVSPAIADGSPSQPGSTPRPLLPVAVTIGGVAADVLYAGSIPGQPTGILQLNVRVPANAPSGAAVPVSVSIGDHASPASGVTVAIE